MPVLVEERPQSYAVLPEGRRRGLALAVHEPTPRPVPRVRLHLKPGQKGTKQLHAEYGDRLVCVRYRYDAQRKKRFKTVEIIVAERAWEPPPPHVAPDQIVGVRVAFTDVAVRKLVKEAGGTWNPERRVWETALR